MNKVAVNHLRSRLAAAERELAGCVEAIHSAVDLEAWANLASHAALASRAAAQIEAFTVALAAAGES